MRLQAIGELSGQELQSGFNAGETASARTAAAAAGGCSSSPCAHNVHLTPRWAVPWQASSLG